MPSLKQYRVRIKSVKSTQKITKAMKMVAAAKLRRAKDNAEVARPYAEKMEQLLRALASGMGPENTSVPLLTGNGRDQVHLLIVATSDRGLCGAFNSSIVRAARRKATELLGEGKQVKFYCIGKKAYDQLLVGHKDRIVGRVAELSKKKKPEFIDAERVARDVIERFGKGEFDVATILYNNFKSAISQVVTFQQLVPLALGNGAKNNNSPYEYEPDEEALLKELLPRNIATQIYRAFLENAASEQGARMTAMDNATRNAGEMIKKLTLTYNRQRQAAITKELIEIISGAEAL